MLVSEIQKDQTEIVVKPIEPRQLQILPPSYANYSYDETTSQFKKIKIWKKLH